MLIRLVPPGAVPAERRKWFSVGAQDLEGVQLCFSVGDAGQHLRLLMDEKYSFCSLCLYWVV